MSYDSQFNGKRTSRYRDSPDRDHSFERKRFRGNGVVDRIPMNDVGSRKNYDMYNSNDRFGNVSTHPNSFSRGMRRSHHQNDSKSRFDSRNMDYIPRNRASNDQVSDGDIPKPSRILGAFGLAPRTEERHLYSMMKKYGDVEEVKILRDSVSTRSRGFGFIYFQNIEDACAARRGCSQGMELHGKMVRIDFSYTKGPYKPTPGMYMGGRDNKRFQSRSNMGGRHSGGFESRRRSPDMFANNNNNGRPYNNRQESSSFYRPQNQRRFVSNHHQSNFYSKRRVMDDDHDRSSSRSPIQFHHRMLSKRQMSPMDDVHSYHRPRSNRTDKRIYNVGGTSADLMVAGMDDQSPASR